MKGEKYGDDTYIDDPLLQRSIIKSAVTAEDHESLEAADGQQGLEVALEQIPDLIISDLIMPTMDGFELLNALSEKGLKMPVIVTTADIQEEAHKQCFALGATQVINKLQNEETLRGAIQNLVRLKREPH